MPDFDADYNYTKSDPFFVLFANENFPGVALCQLGERLLSGQRLGTSGGEEDPTDSARRSEGMLNRILLQFYKRGFKKCIQLKAFFDAMQMFT